MANKPEGQIVVAATEKKVVANYSAVEVHPQDLRSYGTIGFKYNFVNVYFINLNLELDNTRLVDTFDPVVANFSAGGNPEQLI